MCQLPGLFHPVVILMSRNERMVGKLYSLVRVRAVTCGDRAELRLSNPALLCASVPKILAFTSYIFVYECQHIGF